MELVRQVAEGLLGAQRAAVVVHVLQLDVRPEVALLAELAQRPGVAALAPPVLVVLAAGGPLAYIRLTRVHTSHHTCVYFVLLFTESFFIRLGK